ncbi:MAG: signal peptide peptidase SppA [Proteobacteria bacterium]|nr:signal peptide peptidase SppA [Pseudomonadota bacterium]
MLRLLGRFLRRLMVLLFAFVGAVVVCLGAAAGLLYLWVSTVGDNRLPSRMVLSMRPDAALGSEDVGSLSRFLPLRQLSLEDIVEALERAEQDDRVAGLFLDVSGASAGMGEAQELRDAVGRFQNAGKFVLAYADTYEEPSAPYYIASAAHDIWLQPSGDLGLTGVALQSFFLKGALDRLGVHAEFGGRYEYKGAVETFTAEAMSAPVRQNLQTLVDGWFKQLSRDIAGARGLGEPAVRGLIDRAPLGADEALGAKLVDHLGYRGEATAEARKRAGPGAELMTLERYLKRAGRPHERGPTIAVIHGRGTIVRAPGSGETAVFGRQMRADAVARAIAAAAADSDVRAIVLRIDSPGGSYVGSDTVWHEVEAARQKKPVIASLGDVAASGGYFVAMGATRILAEPGTLTGSIGVFGGKFVASDFMRDLGVAVDSVEAGAHVGMWSATRAFTEAERARLEAQLDRIYKDFTGKVAAARGLSAEQIDASARGRVWTGEDAKALGLIDGYGGYRAALSLAREAAGLAADAPITVEEFPRPRRLWDIVDALLDADLQESLRLTLAADRALLGWLRHLLTKAGGAGLAMPPLALP